MKIDTRVFSYAGSSADPDGSYKARFANSPDARPKVMQKAGHTNFVLVALPTPMTKLEAIEYLLGVKPAGVNLEALTAKAAYINALETKLANVAAGVTKQRGRPAKVKTSVANVGVTSAKVSKTVKPAKAVKPGKVAKTEPTPSIVSTIVNNARKGTSIRAKATAHSSKVSSRLAATTPIA